MRRLYRGRQAALREALAADFTVPHEIAGGGAGMHLAVRLPQTCDDCTIVAAARAHGMAPSALSMFAIAPLPTDNGLVLGYGNTAEDRFRPLVQCLSLLAKSSPAAEPRAATSTPAAADGETRSGLRIHDTARKR
jgi:GntR family transcriptional regulator/MocR family aminotransferase